MYEKYIDPSHSLTNVQEDKIMTYARALTGLYERMLNYARVNTQSNPSDFSLMRRLVNLVYSTEDIGFDLAQRLTDGSKRDQILDDLEDEYKRTSLIYKDLFPESLNIFFENELEASFEGNSFIDPSDSRAFNNLLDQVGERVFAQILAKAIEGDPYYQLLLGKCYFLGWGTKVNIEEGLSWIKKSAESGDPDALLYAGLAEETYHNKLTGYRLNPESIKYYQEAFKKGNPEAAYALYRFNKYHLTDYASVRAAKKWLRRGLEEGSVYCNYVDRKKPDQPWAPGNIKNAYDWVRAAASFKEPEAFILLANIYNYGNAGLKPDKGRQQECLYMAERLS